MKKYMYISKLMYKHVLVFTQIHDTGRFITIRPMYIVRSTNSSLVYWKLIFVTSGIERRISGICVKRLWTYIFHVKQVFFHELRDNVGLMMDFFLPIQSYSDPVFLMNSVGRISVKSLHIICIYSCFRFTTDNQIRTY